MPYKVKLPPLSRSAEQWPSILSGEKPVTEVTPHGDLLTKPGQKEQRRVMTEPARLHALLRPRLCGLLEQWRTMDEGVWSGESVERLKNEILDIFRDHPVEAETLYREWKATHPTARLG